MDIHAPHQPVHTWRDFFTHIVIITIGLFIALMLEAGVEWVHHRHLLHQAESNLSVEFSENRSLLAKDEKKIEVSKLALAKNIQILTAAKNHQPVTGSLSFDWYWSSMQNAAWDTARDTSALALMPYDHAQAYAIIYGQQSIVDEQATLFIHDIYRSGAPLEGGRKIADLQPAEIDTMIAASQQTLIDLDLLNDLCRSLDTIYKNVDGKI